MTRIRYTMPARSQGKLHMRRRVAELVEKDVHRWVFVYGMDSDVEALVRKWLVQTHVVLNNARDLNPRDAVKAIVKATGLSPHLSVRGWPFCLNDVNDVGDVNDAEGV